MNAKRIFKIIRPLERLELEILQRTLADPDLLSVQDEATLRYALVLGRISELDVDGVSVQLDGMLRGMRSELRHRLGPLLENGSSFSPSDLRQAAGWIRRSVKKTRERIGTSTGDRALSVLDDQVRNKRLALVLGGGGGTGFVYLGAMAMLEEANIRPSLLAGTSMGAVLSLFRARSEKFDTSEALTIVRSLNWSNLFRVLSTESKYGLPAAFRLFLRAGIGRYFEQPSEHGLTIPKLSELRVPTLMTVAGVRSNTLPHSVDYYERLLEREPSPTWKWAPQQIQRALSTLSEFLTRPEILTAIHLGKDSFTSEFDSLDAAGFSSALPGVIHYDVLRDDERMHGVLRSLFETHQVSRLVDGSLADNMPARAAWEYVHGGRLGARNVFVLSLNAFAPKLSTPLWAPFQQLVELTVQPNRPYSDLTIDFRKTTPALDIVPSVDTVMRAMSLGRQHLSPHMNLLRRALSPIPAFS